jgi:hypothetical protein
MEVAFYGILSTAETLLMSVLARRFEKGPQLLAQQPEFHAILSGTHAKTPPKLLGTYKAATW